MREHGGNNSGLCGRRKVIPLNRLLRNRRRRSFLKRFETSVIILFVLRYETAELLPYLIFKER